MDYGSATDTEDKDEGLHDIKTKDDKKSITDTVVMTLPVCVATHNNAKFSTTRVSSEPETTQEISNTVSPHSITADDTVSKCNTERSEPQIM